MPSDRWIKVTLAGIIMLAGFTGCREREEPVAEQLEKIVLQTDWFAQPEHGGFYQALAKGYYTEAGLDVEILQGGPNSMSVQKVVKGSVHFAMNRADAVCEMAFNGIPVTMVMATLQHDPQGIMMHADNPVKDFTDLNKKQVMAIPGLTWTRWLEAKYGIELEIIPHDYGLERFLSNPGFIQQCLITNEPYFVRLAGTEPKILRLSDSGFDPYHGIYCMDTLTREHPELVRAFVTASIRGWKDFIMNDPSPALELIAERNPEMTHEFIQFIYHAIKENNLVTGKTPDASEVGIMDSNRLDNLEEEFIRLGLLRPKDGSKVQWYDLQFLPMRGDEQTYARP